MTNLYLFDNIIIGGNMNIRKIAYGLLVLSLVLIISGSFSSFLIGLRRDKENTLNLMKVVDDEFETFSANTSVFESFREDLYAEVLEGVVCDQFVLNDTLIKNRLSNYENLVDELSKNVTKLDKLCVDVYYPNSSTNNKCLNYKSIYEQVNNYFVTDINNYNKNVKTCNSNTTSENNIKEFKNTKKYIDFNGDKKYDGKEE